jgi:hypothetical protein
VKKTLAALLSSRKFLVMAASVVAYGASRLGLNISAEEALPAIGLVGTYIIGQGIADNGKERAQVERAERAELEAAITRFDAAARQLETRMAELFPPRPPIVPPR